MAHAGIRLLGRMGGLLECMTQVEQRLPLSWITVESIQTSFGTEKGLPQANQVLIAQIEEHRAPVRVEEGKGATSALRYNNQATRE